MKQGKLPKRTHEEDSIPLSSVDGRLRSAAIGAGIAMFDWDVVGDTIMWDGATEMFPFHGDHARLYKPRTFLDWLSPESRDAVTAVLREVSPRDPNVDLILEARSTFGAVWLGFLGTRTEGLDGRAARLTGAARVITERQRETRRLMYLATRDELTGHLNRNSLLAELSQAIGKVTAEDSGCAFLVATIDRLAVINDGYGFDVGDEVIVAVGERLSRVLRTTDIIGRTAGNKFGVILPSCGEAEIEAVAERMRAVVQGEVIDTHSAQVSATCSVGAVWLPVHASTSQEAMLRAEEALDKAREGGRNGFAAFQKSQQRKRARLELMVTADEVVAALKDDRILLAYQPIVSAKGKRTAVHHESLVRMAKRDGKIVSAGDFIPAAEQLGLVRLVDRRALELAVAELHANPQISLAVNVSGTSAADSSWLRAFLDYVRTNKSVATRLIVELTETAAFNHFELNAQFVSQLAELGCRVAIDDFGAGYTSFRNLQMLKVDMVKIDGAYVKDLCASPENQVFVRTLVGLAQNFNLRTVAEWVNSEDEATLLESFGVDYFQGYFFGPPTLTPPWKATGGN